MKANLRWLQEYVDVDKGAQNIADALTMAGLEVETVQDRFTYLDSVVVARILEIRPHPNADKLQLCTVDIGEKKLPIVCGASNIREQMVIALALPGTVLPDGTVLKKGKIRGEVSEGMICSKKELAIGDDEGGIMVLDDNLEIGRPLNQPLNLQDEVIDIDLTPNRPDCLGIIGIAREVAAFENKDIRTPKIVLPAAKGHIREVTSVTIDDPELCPRYAACLITDITVSPSPFWLQDKLLAVGLKPINNIVDITNFVMMETGQPLHAFDFDNLEENRIVVRCAGEDKTFTTLDEKERTLTPETLMICDGKKPVALAGVMGGLNSEIEDKTTRVLIESAYFNPTSIRKTAKRLGLHSDASHRFERGVDPSGTTYALLRAAQLMVETGGGTLVDGIIDEHPNPQPSQVITLSIPDTNRLIGIKLEKADVARLLKSIGFATEDMDEHSLNVTVPPFRVDVSQPVDLMEEVARLTGYNNIETSFPMIPAKTELADTFLERRNTLKNHLIGMGLTETVNYSFIHELSPDRLRLPTDDYRRKAVKLLNPLSEDQAVMRTSLLPGMLETARRNISRQSIRLKLFETGKIFLENDHKSQPVEIEMAAGLITGTRNDTSWYGSHEPMDFYDLKGIVESLFDSLHIHAVGFSKLPENNCTYLKSGHSAAIEIDGRTAGVLGEIHAEVLSAYNLKQPVFCFEFNLDTLIPLIPVIKSSKDVPKYPSVTRDITLIISKESEVAQVLSAIENMDAALVESIRLFDVYEGKPIPEGKRSISIRITYRSTKKTLKDKDVTGIHSTITDTLLSDFNASLPA